MDKTKSELEEEREELIKQIELIEKPADYGSDTDSLETETDESEEFATQGAKGSELRARLVEVDEALTKILRGE
jgi:hypothetical protein